MTSGAVGCTRFKGAQYWGRFQGKSGGLGLDCCAR